MAPQLHLLSRKWAGVSKGGHSALPLLYQPWQVPRLSRVLLMELETNAEADVVHVIAVDVAAAGLPHPAFADFDLAIARGSPVPDDEMIRETVLHPAHVAVVVIENAGASLPRATVVHDGEFPA